MTRGEIAARATQRATVAWMLYIDGRTMRAVGVLLGVSAGRVAQLVARAETDMRAAARRARRERSPHVERLRAAGALPDLGRQHLIQIDLCDVEIPPA